MIHQALQKKPDNATHWSLRLVGEAEGVSKSTVQRWFSLFGVKPHLSKTFKLSNDPFFIEKVRDITGLYLNPPDHALVLCVDEKSQIQALDRTQPKLPLNLGYVEGFTHDYIRHGTTTLFAALDVATGRVIAKCSKRHRHQDFLVFLNVIDRETPEDLDIHLVLDNYATHKHPKVKAWLAKRPRYHLHFTPTYASWLNQVERWFGLISQRAIKRGSFRSVKELVTQITEFTDKYNATSKPFAWVATAQSILDKVERLSTRINGTRTLGRRGDIVSVVDLKDASVLDTIWGWNASFAPDKKMVAYNFRYPPYALYQHATSVLLIYDFTATPRENSFREKDMADSTTRGYVVYPERNRKRGKHFIPAMSEEEQIDFRSPIGLLIYDFTATPRENSFREKDMADSTTRGLRGLSGKEPEAGKTLQFPP